MALAKMELEIPLTGTMATAVAIEAQDPSASVRLAENVDHSEPGSVRKPMGSQLWVTADTHPGSGSSAGYLYGVIPHGDREVDSAQQLYLHSAWGAMAQAGSAVKPIRPAQSASATDNDITHKFVPIEVTRKNVAGTSGPNEYIAGSAVCVNASGEYLYVWQVRTNDWTGTYTSRVCAQVFDVAGNPKSRQFVYTCSSTGLGHVRAITNSTGFTFFWVDAIAANVATIKVAQYTSSTAAFGSSSTVGTSTGSGAWAAGVLWEVLLDPSNADRFYFAYVGAAATYYPIVELRTVGAVSSTHTGTTNASHGVGLVAGPTYIGVASSNGNTIRSERFGTAASVAIVYSAGTTVAAPRGALETARTDGATHSVVWAWYEEAVIDFTVSDYAYTVSYKTGWDFSASPNAALAKTTQGYIANAWMATNPWAVNGRVYLGVQTDKLGSSAEESDPAIVVIGPYESPNTNGANNGTSLYAVCARYGHDRAAVTFTANSISSQPWVVGAKAHTALIADPSAEVASDAGGRMLFGVTLDYECSSAQVPTPPDYCEINGLTVISGGVVRTFDGREVRPGFQQIPSIKIGVSNTAGAVSWSAASYSAIAIWYREDAAGNLHRSAPSDAVSFTVGANEEPYFQVSAPNWDTWRLQTYTGGAIPILPQEIRCVIYVSQSGGNYYPVALNSIIMAPRNSGIDGFYFTPVSGASIATPDTALAQPYTRGSAGEELASEPPPAAASIARVGDVLWLVDAENRGCVWHSKPVVEGIAPEWNAANRLFFSDIAHAVRDVGGVPTIFAEGGVWQVFGDGPNALGAGTYAVPRRVNNTVSIRRRTDVGYVPGGVAVWATNGVYLMSSGGDVQDIGDALDIDFSTAKCRRIVYWEETDSIFFLMSETVQQNSARRYVYNRGTQRWSIETDRSLTGATVDQWTDAVANDSTLTWCTTGNAGFYRDAPDGAQSSTTATRVQTPWIKLNGISGFGRVWDSYVGVRCESPSGSLKTGIKVTVDYDYDNDSSYTQTVTIPYASVVFEGDVAWLRVKPARQRARAIKYMVEEVSPLQGAGSSGMMPFVVKLICGVDEKTKKKAPQSAV